MAGHRLGRNLVSSLGSACNSKKFVKRLIERFHVVSFICLALCTATGLLLCAILDYLHCMLDHQPQEVRMLLFKQPLTII